MGKIVSLTTFVVFFTAMFCGLDSGGMLAFGADRAKLIEPAMIMPVEDARALTGAGFGECTVSEQAAVGLKLCVYEKDEAFLQIGLTQTKQNGNTPESIYNSIKGAFMDAAKIEGVGDDNFIAPPGLHIMKDGYYMTVSLGLMNKDKEKLKAVGMKAVSNLSKCTQKK